MTLTSLIWLGMSFILGYPYSREYMQEQDKSSDIEQQQIKQYTVSNEGGGGYTTNGNII